MTKDWVQYAKDLSENMETCRKGIPDAWAGFSKMAAGASKDGALEAKTKELIALAIGIAIRCDGCIAFHTRSAIKYGATREEVLETISTAMYMGGGPSSVYGSLALEAYDQFAAAAS
ncbi:carboxymuconolactone decarboxylase family protein [Roseospira marina]|uniref:Carboxymuconolactone decarboxylase family protein n=1 Tax=Roseospira marina TaxID=140057 RepID=A0A5M6IBK9_9PROT|nr:carboxymuconolactone decarboxylase family protein [Roseospira marina]KAA5605502.1 carboxymuconolactone decarboxylase family protein [Roseospira marina]MBB4314493.1 AhpD family alkylhydroperoxidase [Roseospira marina]MBB5088679.1 AhpD family alkylhydroperoxidase [Roseospira marina]